MAAATRMSADEFLARDWPRGTQLIRGEVVVNQPGLRHQLVVGRLHALLLAWRDAAPDRGTVALPVDVRLGDEVYVPDVWWVAGDRATGWPPTGPYPAPDLVAAVRSPSTWRYDTSVKRETYQAHGVAELWLVDPPAGAVIVYRRSRRDARTFDVALELTGDDGLTSPLLPDFAVPGSTLFPD